MPKKGTIKLFNPKYLIEMIDMTEKDKNSPENTGISVADLRSHTESVVNQISRHTEVMKDALSSEKQLLADGLQKQIDNAGRVIDGQRWTVTTVLSIFAALAIGAGYLFGSEFSQLEESINNDIATRAESFETQINDALDNLEKSRQEIGTQLREFDDTQERKLTELATRLDTELLKFEDLLEVQLKLIPSAVRDTVLQDSQTAERASKIWSTMGPLLQNLEDSNEKYGRVLRNAGVVIENFEKLPYSIDAAYSQLEKIETDFLGQEEDFTEENRVRAASLLSTMVSESLEGAVDPNTLFNSSVAANRLGFMDEALKLAILAEWFQTSLHHSAMRLEREALTGVSYDMKDNKLVPVKVSPANVRQNAWAEMLEVIRQLPRQESQQIFFRAKKVANRYASLGYYDDLIDAITDGIEQSSNQPTSYVYVSLADLHASRAAPNWRVEYLKSVDSAVRLLRSEPATASWYEDSVTEMFDTADQLDMADEVSQVLISYGLVPGSDEGG